MMALITSGCVSCRSKVLPASLCRPRLPPRLHRPQRRYLHHWLEGRAGVAAAAVAAAVGMAAATAVVVAVGETVILLHPPLHLVGVSIGINKGVSVK